MAIQKEIWLRDIVNGFFPDNSFASKSVNDDAFVEDGKKVHVPNAGAASKVTKNRTSVPATATKRDDTDVEYPLDEFTTEPVLIPNAESVELSYDKRQSVIYKNRLQLRKVAHDALLSAWAPGKENCVLTTGAGKVAHQNGATGNRKAVTTDDILALMIKFDEADIPAEGRYLLLDAQMYAQLLDAMSNSDKIGFFQAADVKQGIVGNLYGFDVMKRSTVLRYDVTGSTVNGVAASEKATDCAAALAWHESCVRRALGETKIFEDTDSPTYYGDVLSFLVRAGGAASYKDKTGVYALVGITA